MVRTKFEEEVKELTFKIQELEDMLDGKEANLKKRLDEANHWKAQNEQYKGEFKILNAEIEKL
jgi:peptidoglycan hydrolase CwlO-like protein